MPRAGHEWAAYEFLGLCPCKPSRRSTCFRMFCLRSFYDWHHEGVATCINVLLESCADDILVYKSSWYTMIKVLTCYLHWNPFNCLSCRSCRKPLHLAGFGLFGFGSSVFAMWQVWVSSASSVQCSSASCQAGEFFHTLCPGALASFLGQIAWESFPKIHHLL